MLQAISKNFGLAGGTLDATKHIVTALPRLLSKQELDPIRDQMAEMATTARMKQASIQYYSTDPDVQNRR